MHTKQNERSHGENDMITVRNIDIYGLEKEIKF